MNNSIAFTSFCERWYCRQSCSYWKSI